MVERTGEYNPLMIHRYRPRDARGECEIIGDRGNIMGLKKAISEFSTPGHTALISGVPNSEGLASTRDGQGPLLESVAVGR